VRLRLHRAAAGGSERRAEALKRSTFKLYPHFFLYSVIKSTIASYDSNQYFAVRAAGI
jgi:hypothetical protein